MAARFKKPKPLSKQKRKSVEGLSGVTAGFPEFWQKAHDHYPEFFKAAFDLATVVNAALRKPIKGKLAKVEWFLTAIVSNSFGALITLALNGYGHDALRIARGMYEAAVNATYLKKHPKEVDDYVDFYWVHQKRLIEYFEKYSPKSLERISKDTIHEVNTEFERIESRFKGKGKKCRNTWSKKDLRARAEEIGLGELYPTFYRQASGIHHADISGLVSQSSSGTLDVEQVPSLASVGDALIMGHNAVLHVLQALNETADLEMDEQLDDARNRFMEVWPKEGSRR